MSFVAWLDYSERERRKALDVIDLFHEQETRDELGLGVVRDALADRLFPGTSTIQTRARYLLFIPWTYRAQEERRTPSAEVAQRARKEEIQLIEALIKAGDRAGIIGVDARASLRRLPSNIYWLGLGTLGIRLFPGSQEQYHASLDAWYRAAARRPNNELEALEAARIRPNWDPLLPARPETFPRDASLELTAAEASYLQDRILQRVPRTYLAYLVGESGLADETLFPWEHPDVGGISAAITDELGHARSFSEAVHGAALLYNLMLAEKAKNDERVHAYRESAAEWAALITARAATLSSWDRRRFWELVGRVPLPTRGFVDGWLDLVFAGNRAAGHLASPAALFDDLRARTLIYDRERQLKRSQARLENPSALKLWSGAAGAGRMNYRWHRVQVIVSDIVRGLGRTRHA